MSRFQVIASDFLTPLVTEIGKHGAVHAQVEEGLWLAQLAWLLQLRACGRVLEPEAVDGACCEAALASSDRDLSDLLSEDFVILNFQ